MVRLIAATGMILCAQTQINLSAATLENASVTNVIYFPWDGVISPSNQENRAGHSVFFN